MTRPVDERWSSGRFAFNAAEEDCCSCVNEPQPWTCDQRGDGICRCFPLASREEQR